MKPIIKWSGGKADEISQFQEYFPDAYDRYIEPFLGGGALYFSLNPDKAVVNDVHPELVALYRQVGGGHGPEIYEWMAQKEFTEEEYYTVRSSEPVTEFETACRFYYLRKTCYRGMLRYNRSGGFNVPWGRYKRIAYEEVKDDGYRDLLGRSEVYCKDFRDIMADAKEGDFVFLDPPYDSVFTDYGYCSFGKQDHEDLAALFKESEAKCCMVIGDTPLIRKLYAGYIKHEYPKKYRFRLHSDRINSSNIDNKHLVICNY